LAITTARAATPTITAAESVVRLGLTAGYGSYEENLHPQDTESGALLGFSGAIGAVTPGPFGRYGWPDLYANFTYDFSAGLLGYRGVLQDAGNTPYSTRDGSYYDTAIVRLGVAQPVLVNGEVIPYAAGGFQNWYRNVGGAAGYGEYYQTGLMGGGLKLDFAATPVLVLSAAAETYAVIGGTISAPAQDFSAGLGTSAEERVSLDADYRMNDAWHAFAGFGVTHYGYAGSKPDSAGLYEPLSTTLQVNSMFGLAYGF